MQHDSPLRLASRSVCHSQSEANPTSDNRRCTRVSLIELHQPEKLSSCNDTNTRHVPFSAHRFGYTLHSRLFGECPRTVPKTASAHRVHGPSGNRTRRFLRGDAFRPSNILIEDKASGTQLIQELIPEGVYDEGEDIIAEHFLTGRRIRWTGQY
jgi:hypothetical protein